MKGWGDGHRRHDGCGLRENDLEANLDGLLDRIKSGRYFAPPVQRRYIPKADGTRRPLGIPTLEDKVAQRAILMLLEPISEADFLPCSYGFWPGRCARASQAKWCLESLILCAFTLQPIEVFDSVVQRH